LKVGIDLDGVCFDFAASLRRYLVASKKDADLTIQPGEPSRWEFYLDWGLEEWEFIDVCNDGVDAGYIFSGGYIDMAPSAINFIRSLGHSIHIVTDRQFGQYPETSHKATKNWLWEHDIEYDTLTFSADKTCVKTDMFIDDKLSNYDALVAAGVDCYLVDRPWNQDPGDDRKRLKSIQEYATIIGNMSG
jgi:hypothetical protein